MACSKPQRQDEQYSQSIPLRVSEILIILV
jgi:hypothetical protein